MRARGLESPDLADAVIGCVMLNQSGGGAVTEKDLAGIRFGGGWLSDNEPVGWGGERLEEAGPDLRDVKRYPFV